MIWLTERYGLCRKRNINKNLRKTIDIDVFYPPFPPQVTITTTLDIDYTMAQCVCHLWRECVCCMPNYYVTNENKWDKRWATGQAAVCWCCCTVGGRCCWSDNIFILKFIESDFVTTSIREDQILTGEPKIKYFFFFD